MISKIKVEIAFLKKSFLRLPYYELKDITKSVGLPIINIETFDETLDMTDLTIYNKREDPYIPFTKFIITLYEGDKYYRIYRYLDVDEVEQKSFGQNRIFCHKIKLLEPTKILEREPVQNLSFTNYLYEGLSNPFIDIKKEVGQGTSFNSYCYSSGNRFPSVVELGNSIPNDSKLKVSCSTKGVITLGSIPVKTIYFNLKMEDALLIAPSGQSINIKNQQELTFTEEGVYKVVQTYYGKKEGMYLFYAYCGVMRIQFTWTIKVIKDAQNLTHSYTITEVLNRLLNCFKCRQETIHEQRYLLDPNIAERFKNIPSPEFNFTNATLFEALSQIGGYVHAIPRLIPLVVENEEGKEDYWTNWNIVTFDVLDDGDDYNNDDYSMSGSSSSSENFTQGVVVEVQNGLQSAYNKNASMIEPFLGGFISTRTESSDFEINNDTFCLKTSLPIGYVKKLRIYYEKYEGTPTEVIDITPCVVEKSIYDTFKVYDGKSNSSEAFESKFGYLYFERGKPNIKGCDYQKKFSNFIQEFFDSFDNKNSLEFAMKKVKGDTGTTKYGTRNARSICYQIEYIPYLSFMAKQNKDYIDSGIPNIYTYYNQNANVVDIDSLGEHTRGVLAKLSNTDYIETQYLKEYLLKPKIGQRSKDNYRCFSVASEIWMETPIKVTTKWSKNYNKLNENVSYKKAIREYEISENGSFERYIDCEEFLIVSDKLDVEEYYDVASGMLERKIGENFSEIQDNIEEELEQVQICNEKMVNVIANRISGIEKFPIVTTPSDEWELNYPSGFSTTISYAYMQTFNDGDETPIQTFILPVSSFTFGNSIIFLTKTQDNYSAQSTVKTKSDNTALEDNIDYGDEHGRADKLKVAYGFFSPFKDYKANLAAKGKMLYKFDGELNEEDLVIDLRSYPFIIDKDSRESISLTTMLSICTDNSRVKLGKNVTNIVPFITNDYGRFKFVLFKKKPRMFDSVISEDDFDEVMDWSKWTNLNIRTIQIIANDSVNGRYTATMNYEGYGMLDKQNNLMFFVNKPLVSGDGVPDTFLMFRKNV